MGRVELRTGGEVDELALAEAYRRLLAAGDDGELVVRLAEPPVRLDLVPDEAPWYQVPFAVAIVADGEPVTLSHVPIRVAARDVRLAGLVMPDLTGDAVQLVATGRVELDGCELVRLVDPRPTPAVAVRVASPHAEPTVMLRGCRLRTLDEGAPGPVLLVQNGGAAPAAIVLDGCDVGPGLGVVADGAARLVVRGRAPATVLG